MGFGIFSGTSASPKSVPGLFGVLAIAVGDVSQWLVRLFAAIAYITLPLQSFNICMYLFCNFNSDEKLTF